ncbi:MAG: hypothetical protein LZF62_140149 [Nitrospira sp.]|nr:MAG: hypothetical protein LZF62_140149 [Nitrospira sp.]
MPKPPVRIFLIVCVLTTFFTTPIVVLAEEATPPPQPTLTNRLPAFQEVARANATQLSALPAQGDALTLFKTVIGPQLGLSDAAMTVGAKGLTPAMSQELLISDLTRAASELVRGLAAWHLAQTARALDVSGTVEPRENIQKQIDAQTAWLSEGTTLGPALGRLRTLSASEPTEDTAPLMGGAAAQIEAWAIDTVTREWFRIYNWKDQVRQQRGLVRLCGTWQWSIHNHQNHREEKTAVIFAPPGSVSATSPAEIIVLGDSVYLRWETRAGVQEDSLLFSGEGQRLEGTFVNTAGGWGSITGKRTATCFNEGSGKGTSPRRRHH